MAHQFSSDKSHDQIPPQPLQVKKPHKPKDNNTKQKEGDSETSSSYGASNNKIYEVRDEDSGRERLKRHRVEVAGSVWIPEIWGQEELLKDWIDSSVFDAPLLPTKILTARTALVHAATASTPTTVLVD